MKTETKPKPKLPKIPAAPDSRAPALAVEAWPVDRPKPYAKNPRRNDAAVEKVAASIREFGWAQPIVVDGDGEIVLDAFLGSGTTIIAAEKTGRVCYGMELDPHYCDVIRKRWSEFVHGEGCDWKTLAPEVDA